MLLKKNPGESPEFLLTPGLLGTESQPCPAWLPCRSPLSLLVVQSAEAAEQLLSGIPGLILLPVLGLAGSSPAAAGGRMHNSDTSKRGQTNPYLHCYSSTYGKESGNIISSLSHYMEHQVLYCAWNLGRKGAVSVLNYCE